MRRFYKKATVQNSDKAYLLIVDSSVAKTPARRELRFTSEALARAVTEEWNAQKDEMDLDSMPLTRLSCIALDIVQDHRAVLVQELIEYGRTDLVCYRSDAPELARRQKQLDHIIGQMQRHYSVRLITTQGVMPVPQPADNDNIVADILNEFDDWRLAGLSAAVKPLSSLALGLALLNGWINAGEAFTLSHLEEEFETENWGEDDEKEAKLASYKADILHIERFFGFLPR